MVGELKVLPVHKHHELQDECSEILNQEWPRSKAARIHSISKSTDSLPVSLAFVRLVNSKLEEVLGFSKISAVQGIKHAGLVESVVLRVNHRGKGLGRDLMNLTEEYGQRLGIKTMYLSTKDKEGFYARLGYEKCQPVLSLGANAHRVPESMLLHFMAATSLPSQEPATNENAADVHNQKEDKQQENKNATAPFIASPPSSPPPPPLPPSIPPPPPPPSSLPPSLSNKCTASDRVITRLDPNCVTWMKKALS